MTLKDIKENRYPVEDFGGVRIDWLIDRVEELEELLDEVILESKTHNLFREDTQ